MPTPKANDLSIVADFLERESRRYESFKSVHEAILRIGSLVDAESAVRLALEEAQADLAWAREEIDASHASVAAAKEAARRQIDDVRLEAKAAMALTLKRHEEMDRRLQAETEEKRAALEKIIARIETARAAAEIIVGAFAKERADTSLDTTAAPV